jgi:uncharacterized protein
MTGTAQVPVVAVRGEAVREVDPEIARFAVTVSARDRDRSETLRRLAARVDAVRAVLDRYRDAVDRRETAGLFVHPEIKGAGEKITGYRGNVTTTVTVTDFAVLGELMLRLAGEEQTTVAGPWWGLRPDSPAHRETRHLAIADALERAREYAAALGARITGLIELTDAGLGAHPVPGGRAQPLAYRSAAAEAGVPQLDLEPQRQEVRASIEARLSISEPAVLTAG